MPTTTTTQYDIVGAHLVRQTGDTRAEFVANAYLAEHPLIAGEENEPLYRMLPDGTFEDVGFFLPTLDDPWPTDEATQQGPCGEAYRRLTERGTDTPDGVTCGAVVTPRHAQILFLAADDNAVTVHTISHYGYDSSRVWVHRPGWAEPMLACFGFINADTLMAPLASLDLQANRMNLDSTIQAITSWRRDFHGATAAACRLHENELRDRFIEEGACTNRDLLDLIPDDADDNLIRGWSPISI